jgi:subtilisin family serine protease
VLKVDLDVGGQGSLNQSRPWVNADQAQSAGMTGAGRIVAVLDSGFDSDHPDLSDALVDEHCNCYNPSVNCCPLGDSVQNGPGSAEDDHGHGSHVSGIITGNGNNAPLGIAPGANIVAVKVLDSNGSFYSSSDIVAALDWILNHRPEVDAVNMSLGTNMEFSGDCDNSSAWTMNLANAVNALRFEGILCVASSMNSGNSAGMGAPACISNVIAVGATFDNQDLITSYSNSSPSLDVLAPGNLITATAMGGGSITMSGTSMAAPHVTATAALLRQKNPTVQASQMEAALETSPVLISDSRNGISRPRLDVKAALDVITVPAMPWMPLLLLDD